MADRESTSLPAAETSASSTATPNAKSAEMSSQDSRTEVAQETEKTTSSGAEVVEPEQVEDDASPIAAEQIDTHHLAGADDTLDAVCFSQCFHLDLKLISRRMTSTPTPLSALKGTRKLSGRDANKANADCKSRDIASVSTSIYKGYVQNGRR